MPRQHETDVYFKPNDREVQSFELSIPDRELADLRSRLRQTRWPERETVEDWSQGIPLAFVQELCEYWADQYDWRVTEARLNAIGQFRTAIDGLTIHGLHARSATEDALPIVITHGWPGSVIEFVKAIGPLTDPAAYGGDPTDAFHVVCPSLPGFGFSERPSTRGWGVRRIADAWAELMDRLGYERFGAQGGDYGAVVSSYLAQRHPDHVVGIHLNDVIAQPDESTMDSLTEAEQAILDALAARNSFGSGYFVQQATRPQTLAYALVDSPAAQCAWVVEKLRDWTDCDGDLYRVLTRDEVLDHVMMYWLTGTGGSAGRLYWESVNDPVRAYDPVDVPVGCSIFAGEVDRASRRWAEKRFSDIRWWNEIDKGGHFPAWEQPDAFVSELRNFFRTVR